MGKTARQLTRLGAFFWRAKSHESASKVQLDPTGRSKVPDADESSFFMSKVLLEPVLGFSFEEFQFLENPQRKGKRGLKREKRGSREGGKEERGEIWG